MALIVGAIIWHRGQEPQTTDPPGRWPATERAAFIDSCVKSCRAAPGVTSAQHPVCDQACKCSADEAEKIVTGQELMEMYKAMQSGKASKEQNDKLEKMKAAGLTCAAQGGK